jgi:hypothetical protein
MPDRPTDDMFDVLVNQMRDACPNLIDAKAPHDDILKEWVRSFLVAYGTAVLACTEGPSEYKVHSNFDALSELVTRKKKHMILGYHCGLPVHVVWHPEGHYFYAALQVAADMVLKLEPTGKLMKVA